MISSIANRHCVHKTRPVEKSVAVVLVQQQRGEGLVLCDRLEEESLLKRERVGDERLPESRLLLFYVHIFIV